MPLSLPRSVPAVTANRVLVVDTSAVVAAVTEDPPPEAVQARLSTDGDLHAPHLLDVEVVGVLRRLVRQGELRPARAEAALEDLSALRITRYPHVALRERMWDLRDNLTAYDAAFVALSEALEVPLVTLDRRLARASGHHAAIEVL